ncbi:MAG: transcriptional repressor [Clostridiales bacterium]|nr:transcriptional repressor [Clostridiales bacterium]
MKKEYSTKSSQAIMDYISGEKEGSFSAKDVHDYLETRGITANLSTIYRNLDKLVDKNILVKFRSSKSDSGLYRVVDTTHSCHRHLHLQCRKCGKIYHLSGEFMNTIDSYIKSGYNFTLDCQNSLLTGICAECSKLET